MNVETKEFIDKKGTRQSISLSPRDQSCRITFDSAKQTEKEMYDEEELKVLNIGKIDKEKGISSLRALKL